MEDVAKLVDRILVMHKGKLQMDGSTREIFRKAEELESLGLGIPQITKFMKKFKEKGNDVKDDVLTVDEAKEEILKFLRRKEDA